MADAPVEGEKDQHHAIPIQETSMYLLSSWTLLSFILDTTLASTKILGALETVAFLDLVLEVAVLQY